MKFLISMRGASSCWLHGDSFGKVATIPNVRAEDAEAKLGLPYRLILICAISGSWYYYYKSKCHGMDECAAQAAESRERDTPREPR